MKNNILILLIAVLSFACTSNSNKTNSNTKKSTVQIKKDTVRKKTKKIIHLDTLIPMTIVDAKNTDNYKKYGLDFGGNCYACDLAQFTVKNNEVVISNVCDANINLKFKILKFSHHLQKIEITTTNYNFIFSKIVKEPIYQLQIINNDIDNKKLRISSYYTFSKDLMKFEVHDCGDFDG